METFTWALPVVLGLFGLLFGSFANVVVWRLPRGESVAWPGSHCPSCGEPIRWYDNIPVISWLFLRARCRDCGGPISWRYPLVEALSGLLWASAGIAFGMSWRTAACVALFYLLLVLSFIDLDTFRLPNPLVAALAGLGLSGVLAAQLTGAGIVPLVGTAAGGPLSSPVAAALAGALLGAGLTAGIAVLYGAARGRSGLGAGDVKLLGAIGLFTGPYVLLVLLLGSVVGSLVGIVWSRLSHRPIATLKIPFGPFLSAGAVATVLFGPALWSAYMTALGVR